MLYIQYSYEILKKNFFKDTSTLDSLSWSSPNSTILAAPEEAEAFIFCAQQWSHPMLYHCLNNHVYIWTPIWKPEETGKTFFTPETKELLSRDPISIGSMLQLWRENQDIFAWRKIENLSFNLRIFKIYFLFSYLYIFVWVYACDHAGACGA